MEDKINKISDWLNEQGYPLEMYCENILSQNGFSVIQSLLYEDEETKKYREIDILATKFKVYSAVTFNFSIVIECKLSKDKPWLLFARKPHKDRKDEILKDAFATNNGSMLIDRSTALKNFSLLTYVEETIGFNLTQCFTTGKDIPYQAVMGTLNACEHLVKKSNDSIRKFCNLYFPIIVIDGDLYKCNSNSESNMKIESIDSGKLLSIRSYSERTSILHTIVTKNGFKSFAENLALELNNLIENLESDFQHISQVRPSNSRYTVL